MSDYEMIDKLRAENAQLRKELAGWEHDRNGPGAQQNCWACGVFEQGDMTLDDLRRGHDDQ